MTNFIDSLNKAKEDVESWPQWMREQTGLIAPIQYVWIKYTGETRKCPLCENNFMPRSGVNPVVNNNPICENCHRKHGRKEQLPRRNMKTTYNKLIRDKVLENILEDGATCEIRKLSEEEYEDALKNKLQEEIQELIEAPNEEKLDELVDIQEVVNALIAHYTTWDKFNTRCQHKRADKGGFNKRYLLVSMEKK